MIELRDIRIPAPVFNVIGGVLEEAQSTDTLQMVLSTAGVTVEQFRDPDYEYNGEQLLHFLRLLKQFAGSAAPELLLRHWSWSSLGMLGLAGLSSASLADSALIAKSFCHTYMPAISVEFDRGVESARLTIKLQADLEGVEEMMLEVAMFVLEDIGQELTGGLPPHAIHLEHANQLGVSDAEASQRYRSFLDCDVVFSSSFTGIEQSLSFWETPCRSPNQMTRDMAISVLKKQEKVRALEDGFACRARRALEAAARSNHFLNLDELADVFHVTPRTMIRRLASEGLQYQALLSEVRFEKAKGLLSGSELSIKRVAFHAGYKDTNAFARAFKIFSGTTPTQWRESAQSSSR
jgi:AraC-like DNA-binding protein